MSQEPSSSCYDAARLLDRMASDARYVSRQEGDALESHVAGCADCAKAFCVIEGLNEVGSLPLDDPAWSAAATGLTAEEGWQDLLRRRPDLAAEYQQELRQERLRRISRRIGAVSALAACILVAIALGLWSGSKHAGGLITSIESPKHSNLKTLDRTDPLDGDLTLELPDAPAEAMPNLNGVDYVTWLERNAAGFAAEFPSRLSVQHEQSDYIEQLALSGDLFQFQGDPVRGDNQSFASESSMERSASIALSKAGAATVSAPRGAIVRWINAVASAEQGSSAEQTQLLLFSLRAGHYLANTREAAALWAIHHADEAKSLFTPHNGKPSVHGVALQPTADAAKNLPEFFERQALAANQIMRTAEDLLSVSPDARCLSSSKTDWQKLRDLVGRFREDSHRP